MLVKVQCVCLCVCVRVCTNIHTVGGAGMVPIPVALLVLLFSVL